LSNPIYLFMVISHGIASVLYLMLPFSLGYFIAQILMVLRSFLATGTIRCGLFFES
jgi:hypothetical protein